MRTGVLADSVGQSRFAPLSREMHDRHFTKPHVDKHKMQLKKPRDDRFRPTQIARAPHMALHEYAQILNPLNVKPFVEAFGDRIEAAKTHATGPKFQAIVAAFNIKHPSYSTEKGMLPEKAFFIEQLSNFGYKISDKKLDKYFLRSNQHATKPSLKQMGKPLSDLHEKIYNEERLKGGDVAVLAIIEEVYKEAENHLVPPLPPNVSMGMSSAESSRAQSRSSSQERSPRRGPRPARSPDRDRSPQSRRPQTRSSRSQSRAAPSPIAEEIVQ